MPFELVRPDTRIDFISQRRLAGLLSLSLIVASVIAVGVRGVRLGIDFAGGTEVQVRFAEGVDADEGRIRAIANVVPGIENVTVVRYGSERDFLVKFRELEETGGAAAAGAAAESAAETGEEAADEAAVGEEAVPPAEAETEEEPPDHVVDLSQALGRGIGAHSLERVEFVGPRVGQELRADGAKALLYASLVILAYIAFRFSSRFAPGAIVAVLHDLTITAGIFVLLGLEFDLRILAAMLAILGYSLNDTIIIYDRIRENMELRTKVDLPEVLNESVNQTLSRTVLTSGTTLAALIALMLLGGDVIRPFAFAMTVGVLVGTYSSIYIAAPTLLLLEQRMAAAK